MRNNRLTRLLNILDNTEKRKLRQTLEISTKEQEMLVLYDYLIKYSAKPKRLDKERVFEEVYPKDTVFNGRKLSDLNTQLYHLAEDFIIVRLLKRKERMAQRQLLMLEYLREKTVLNNKYSDDLNSLNHKIVKDLEHSLSRTDHCNLSHYFNLYQLNIQRYYLNTDKWQEGRLHIEALMENLDIFYCLTKLRYAGEILMRERILNENLPVLLLDELRQYSEVLSKKGIAQASTYRLHLDLLQEFDEVKFHQLVEHIFEYEHTLERVELSNILIFLANHAAKATREGDANLVVANYEIYKLGLENEVFIENGFVPSLLLVNYALLCSTVGKTENLEEILVRYQDRIKVSEKENTTLLCRAYQHFADHEFYAAYRLVSKHSKKRLSFALHQKPLELKCLYELENTTDHIDTSRTLYDACMVYRRYLQRKSDVLNNSTYTANLNFVNTLLKLGEPDTDTDELMKTLKGVSVIHRNWLMEKIKAKK